MFRKILKNILFATYRCPFKESLWHGRTCLDVRLTCHNGENLDNQFSANRAKDFKLAPTKTILHIRGEGNP